jgi:general secretion pathway protein K
MAMLIVAAAATLVSGALWQQSALIRETENELQYAQARWLIRGAIDWAGVILREDARTSSLDHLGEPWAVPLADTRLNEDDGRPAAYLAGAIQDEQAKFNLRNLAANEGINERELLAFRRLLGLLAIDEAVAERVAHRVEAAVRDTVAQRPALGLVALEELLIVEGIEPLALERLRTFITVLPEPTVVNVNTAAAEILSSQFALLPLIDARRVVAGRERAYFKDLGDVRSRLIEAGAAPGDTQLAVASRYFTIEGNVVYGNARLRARALVKREGVNLQVLWLKEIG